MPIFRIKSVKIYTGQKKLHGYTRGSRYKYHVWSSSPYSPRWQVIKRRWIPANHCSYITRQCNAKLIAHFINNFVDDFYESSYITCQRNAHRWSYQYLFKKAHIFQGLLPKRKVEEIYLNAFKIYLKDCLKNSLKKLFERIWITFEGLFRKRPISGREGSDASHVASLCSTGPAGKAPNSLEKRQFRNIFLDFAAIWGCFEDAWDVLKMPELRAAGIFCIGIREC